MMASTAPTPSKRTLTRPRPSLKTKIAQPPSSPAPAPIGSPQLLSPSSMLARKASFQQLTQNSLASIPDDSSSYGLKNSSRTHANDESFPGASVKRDSSTDIEVGDIVNTPGGMYGTVKFIGNVRGKAGVFVGVELEGDMAGKGKNDGAVDGVRYFTTATPMSGIFVPLSKASKRNSASSSNPPPTPPLTGFSGLVHPSFQTSGKRPESPAPSRGGFSNGTIGRTPRRPSVSRSESPVRKQTPGPKQGLAPPSRNISAPGSRLLSPSPTPGKTFGGDSGSMRSRTSSISRPGTSGGLSSRMAQPGRIGNVLNMKPSVVQLRSGSSVERRPLDDDLDSGLSGLGISRNTTVDRESDEAFMTLQRKLAEREKQLEEQAASLLEMEVTLSELQALVANAQHANATSPRRYSFEDAEAPQLRALLREKNEKISLLTTEFDSHRADFRSTIDALELANSETVRVYEKRVEDLLMEIRELQTRGEDVDSVARQLKQLEELVAELEEGLEDARRGEAEARAEVEFLRGEVERSREELRREKEKSAAAVANAAFGKSTNEELEKKDEEIRGLKAIIHSLSRDTVEEDDLATNASSSFHAGGTEPSINAQNGKDKRTGRLVDTDLAEELSKEKTQREKLERDIKELEAEIIRKTTREKDLERELEKLKQERRTSLERRASQMSEVKPSAFVTRHPSTSGPPPSSEVPAAPTRPSRSTSVASWRSTKTTTGTKDQVDAFTNGTNAALPSTKEDEESNDQKDQSAIATDIDTDIDDGPNDSQKDENGIVLWCEICVTSGHDILTCTNMFSSTGGGPAVDGPGLGKKTQEGVNGFMDNSFTSPESFTPTSEKKKSIHLPPPPPLPSNSIKDFGASMNSNASMINPPIAGKESGIIDENKWCALCERDGHDSVDCPFEEQF